VLLKSFSRHYRFVLVCANMNGSCFIFRSVLFCSVLFLFCLVVVCSISTNSLFDSYTILGFFAENIVDLDPEILKWIFHLTFVFVLPM
jgi:hypothetical protein